MSVKVGKWAFASGVERRSGIALAGTAAATACAVALARGEARAQTTDLAVSGCPCPDNLLLVRDDQAVHSALMSG